MFFVFNSNIKHPTDIICNNNVIWKTYPIVVPIVKVLVNEESGPGLCINRSYVVYGELLMTYLLLSSLLEHDFLCMIFVLHYLSLCLLFFHLLARKPNLEEKTNFLFIKTNSFIIFTCLNPVLPVPGFGQVG